MRKFIFILISVAILLLFSACGEVVNNNTSQDNFDNTKNDNIINTEDLDEVINKFEKKYTISYMGIATYDVEKMEASTLVQDTIEEKFNIDLEFSLIAADDKENISILVASQSLPDCGWVYSGVTRDSAVELYEGGAIRLIPIEYIKEYAPNYWEVVESEPSFHNFQLAEGTTDSYFTMFAYRKNYSNAGWYLKMRLNWLENLNYQPKGNIHQLNEIYSITDQAYTIDEFSDIIYAFTYSDPDMNGENDTIGHIIYSQDITDFSYNATVNSAYGVHSYYTQREDGWAVPSDWSPQAKKAYSKVSEWLDLKVVNTDGGNVSSSIYAPRWSAGMYGSISHNITHCFFYDRELVANYPETKLLYTPGLLDNDGSGGKTNGYEEFACTPSAGYFFVNSNVDDEKLKRILLFFDYVCIDQEGAMFCNYGEEGKHYKLDLVYREIVALDQTELPAEEQVNVGLWRTPISLEATSVCNTEGISLASEIFKYMSENWPATMHSYIVAPFAKDLNRDLPWWDRANKAAVIKAKNDFLDRVYSGDSNLETAWDTLMATFNNMGYQDYLVDINENSYLDEEYRKGELVYVTDVYPK